MTRDQIRQLAQEPWAEIGNHTHHHALLENLEPIDVAAEIRLAQEHLQDITGKAPSALAYPNGRHNAKVRQTTQRLGIRLAFTTAPKLQRLPLVTSDLMSLGRCAPMPTVMQNTQARPEKRFVNAPIKAA